MKKSILYTFAIAVFLLTGCDDMLDKSPRDQLINTPVFWKVTAIDFTRII